MSESQSLTYLEHAEGIHDLELQLRHHAQRAQVDGGGLEHLLCRVKVSRD